jgi:hypothetical protein
LQQPEMLQHQQRQQRLLLLLIAQLPAPAAAQMP